MNTKKLQQLLSEVNSVVHKLNVDTASVNQNYETLPMLTYYTLMDMARYCQKFSQKLELVAVEYKILREEKE